MNLEVEQKVRRLRKRVKLHFVLASVFSAGTLIGIFAVTTERGSRIGAVDMTVAYWEVIVMCACIAIVNLFLGRSAQRRSAQLQKDPEADVPEAAAF